MPEIRNGTRLARYAYNIAGMTCDLCDTDDGKGIHYHAFIDGRHYWVCAVCKDRLRVEADHTDE